MTDRQEPRRMFRYTTDSYLTVDPALAQAIGLDEAIVLTRITYLLHLSKGKEGHADESGTTWVWNSYDEWRCDHFPFFTKSHVIEIIRKLEREGLLVSKQRTSHDRRKLYTIDYAAVDDCVRKATFPMATEPASLLPYRATSQANVPLAAGPATGQDGSTTSAESRGQVDATVAEQAGHGTASAAAESRGQADATAATPQTGHGTGSADSGSRGQADATAAAEQAGHGAASASAEKPSHRPPGTEAMNARNLGLQEGESRPPCEKNPRLQGRDTTRCYRENIQQTIHQNTRREALSTRQRLLSSFKVSERVTGYV